MGMPMMTACRFSVAVYVALWRTHGPISTLFWSALLSSNTWPVAGRIGVLIDECWGCEEGHAFAVPW